MTKILYLTLIYLKNYNSKQSLTEYRKRNFYLMKFNVNLFMQSQNNKKNKFFIAIIKTSTTLQFPFQVKVQMIIYFL